MPRGARRAARRAARRVRLRGGQAAASHGGAAVSHTGSGDFVGSNSADGRSVLNVYFPDDDDWKSVLWNGLRTVVLMVLVVTYGFTIACLDGDREMLSAGWREILGELFPDEPKSAERITEAEIVPKWAEFLHADDVTKQLNWFQTFCKDKHGMDDHLEFFWVCNIIKTELDWKEHEPPLAPFMNCSNAFVTQHIIKGDDPRCVPWASNSLKLLQKLESSQNHYDSKVGSVDEIYDEYTVRDGNPMWETVDAGFEEVNSRLNAIEELIAKSGDRRLEEEGKSLHECPKDMRCPWRNVNDDREPEDVPCHCFDYGLRANGLEGWKSTRACRNHHWGLMHLCRPRYISVTFHIARVIFKRVQGLERRQRVLWFSVEMVFSELEDGVIVGSPSGWYRTYLNLREGEFYGFKTKRDGLAAVVTLLLVFSLFIFEFIWTAVRFPSNLKKLLELRQPSAVVARLQAEDGAEEWGQEDPPPSLEDLREVFHKNILEIVDGRGARSTYMKPSMIVAENATTVLAISGFISALIFSGRHEIPREYDTSEKISPSEYIMQNMHGYRLPTELIYELFFDDGYSKWHGAAWLILYFRTLFYFLQLLPGLRWIPLSLTLASVRVMYFLLAYGFLILGFGLLAHIQFGSRFVQFSGLERTCLELFFLSCGVPGTVFDDLFPFEDEESWLACLFLALFVVVAVTLGLNFFTTIILDAYNISTDPETAKQVLDDSWNTICDMLMQSLGIPVAFYVSESGECEAVRRERGASVVREVEMQSTPTTRGTSVGPPVDFQHTIFH